MTIQGIVGPGQVTVQPDLRAAGAARGPDAPVAPARQPREPSPQEVQQAVKNINLALRASRNTALQFSFDPGSRTTVVKVVDTESGELIRQFPSETALAIAESIDSFQKGLLLGQEA